MQWLTIIAAVAIGMLFGAVAVLGIEQRRTMKALQATVTTITLIADTLSDSYEVLELIRKDITDITGEG